MLFVVESYYSTNNIFLFANLKTSIHTKKATQCGFYYSFMNKLGAV